MDIQIRAASPPDSGPIAKVHVDTWRTAYTGIVPVDYLAGLSYGERESSWYQILTTNQPATSNFVAETECGDVVGFAGGGPEREANKTYRGELYAIYLLDSHQHSGIGRRLVSTVARRLQVDGFDSMLVWVLEANHPACRFYELLGGERVSRKTINIGGSDLVEVSYGWRDIAGLAAE